MKNKYSNNQSKSSWLINIISILRRLLVLSLITLQTYMIISDGRSHYGCCRGLDVPVRCLTYCAGMVPTPSTSGGLQMHCLTYIADIVGCMQHGHCKRDVEFIDSIL